MSEWISVKKRKPDDESVIGFVLVRTTSDWVGRSSYADNYDMFTVSNVTHWMPLPELPRELSDE